MLHHFDERLGLLDEPLDFAGVRLGNLPLLEIPDNVVRLTVGLQADRGTPTGHGIGGQSVGTSRFGRHLDEIQVYSCTASRMCRLTPTKLTDNGFKSPEPVLKLGGVTVQLEAVLD